MTEVDSVKGRNCRIEKQITIFILSTVSCLISDKVETQHRLADIITKLIRLSCFW